MTIWYLAGVGYVAQKLWVTRVVAVGSHKIVCDSKGMGSHHFESLIDLLRGTLDEIRVDNPGYLTTQPHHRLCMALSILHNNLHISAHRLH